MFTMLAVLYYRSSIIKYISNKLFPFASPQLHKISCCRYVQIFLFVFAMLACAVMYSIHSTSTLAYFTLIYFIFILSADRRKNCRSFLFLQCRKNKVEDEKKTFQENNYSNYMQDMKAQKLRKEDRVKKKKIKK